MSIKISPIVDVELDSVIVNTDHTTDVSINNTHEIVHKELDSIIEGYKSEYSIVGDGLFASISADEAPEWLTNIIDSVVDLAVERGMVDYDLLVQDVRSAIDSILIAKNQFVEKINFTTTVEGIIATRLQTLNATYNSTFATKVELDTAIATAELALTQNITSVQASLNDNVNSRIETITTAYTTADEALASDITALTTVFTNQEGTVQAAADAVTALQTYLGLTEDYVPTGGGLLNQIDLTLASLSSTLTILQKQNDGVVETFSGTHVVITEDIDPNDGIDLTELLTNQWPYALWTPMFGTVDPTATTRLAYKGAISSSYPIEENTVYKNTAANTYWEYSDINGWVEITQNEYDTAYEITRASHVGDAYVYYQVSNGQRQFIASYKFLKGEIDDTPPYETDGEGYGWVKITDTAAQEAYIQALNAYALADGKISQFYAWGGISAPADFTFLNNDGSSETILGSNFTYWFRTGKLYRKIGSTWTAITDADRVFFAGDIVTVYDPVTRDYTNYTYNGTSWVQVGPQGIIATSKYIVDLENEVIGPEGHVANALSQLETSATAYANSLGAYVESKFAYGSIITLNGLSYSAGFGLTTTGVTQPPTADGSITKPFSSEFWINADKFKFTNSSGSQAISPFSIDTTVNPPVVKFNGTVELANDFVLYEDIIGLPQHTSGYTEPTGTAVNGSSYIQYTTNNEIMWIYNNGWQTTQDVTALHASDLGVNGTTVINGARIATGTLSANTINGGVIYVSNLNDAAVPSYYTGTVMDKRGVRVYNSGVLRVKLGDLT